MTTASSPIPSCIPSDNSTTTLLVSGGNVSFRTPNLVCFDNPLLDIHTNVDEKFLARWDLSSNGAIMANENHLPLFHEIRERNTDPSQHLVPGGSGLNTVRMLKWCCHNFIPEIWGNAQPQLIPSVTFVGTIAKDGNGDILMQESTKAGVTFLPRYLEESANAELPPNSPTGTCAVLVNGVHRSLVAHLGAGAFFDSDWLSDKGDIAQALLHASHVYITGFFLRSSPPTCRSLATFSREHAPLPIIFNLSAPFIVEYYTDLVSEFLPHCHIVFGNAEEYIALGLALGWTAKRSDGGGEPADPAGVPEAEKVLERVLAMTSPHSPVITNYVVMTNGSASVMVARRVGTAPRVTSYPVSLVPLERITDTNGAGDAFVAGFVAALLSLEHQYRAPLSPEMLEYVAVQSGIAMAQMTMRSTGCTLLESPLAEGLPRKQLDLIREKWMETRGSCTRCIHL